jgi:hypothetical protein
LTPVQIRGAIERISPEIKRSPELRDSCSNPRVRRDDITGDQEIDLLNSVTPVQIRGPGGTMSQEIKRSMS